MLEARLASKPQPVILGCASQGRGSGDEARLQALLARFNTRFLDFNKSEKARSFRACLRALQKGQFDLFALEGTGLAAGLAAILGRLLWGRPYVVSSGDAVAPFLSARLPIAAPLFLLYEYALYRLSAGFIGWTPYLVGRALTLGAPRGVTIPGWAPSSDADTLQEARHAVRQALSIPREAVVFGIAGSLSWSSRYQFCYGAELVRAAARCTDPPYLLIVGDGTGLPHLKELAGERLGRTVLLTGRVPKNEVARYLAAMDFGSLPQTVDGVGSFRYTTKLPEYKRAGLRIVTNQIPMAYDLDEGDMVRLRGNTPWDEVFLSDLAALMRSSSAATPSTSKTTSAPTVAFEQEDQVDRVTAFLKDIIETHQVAAGKTT